MTLLEGMIVSVIGSASVGLLSAIALGGYGLIVSIPLSFAFGIWIGKQVKL